LKRPSAGLPLSARAKMAAIQAGYSQDSVALVTNTTLCDLAERLHYALFLYTESDISPGQ